MLPRSIYTAAVAALCFSIPYSDLNKLLTTGCHFLLELIRSPSSSLRFTLSTKIYDVNQLTYARSRAFIHKSFIVVIWNVIKKMEKNRPEGDLPTTSLENIVEVHKARDRPAPAIHSAFFFSIYIHHILPIVCFRSFSICIEKRAIIHLDTKYFIL